MSRSLICLFFISATSATFPSWKFYFSSRYKPFTYYKDLALLMRRTSDGSGRTEGDNCRICYGDEECLELSNARCEYFVTTSNIVDTNQDMGDVVGSAPQLRAGVDSLLYDVIETATSQQPPLNCIPFISRFTDCNKDNTCMGCKICDCDAAGAWNCSQVYRCRPDQPRPPLDHRVLMIVLEDLKADYVSVNRVKRSSPVLESTSISYEVLQEWMYGDNTTRASNDTDITNRSDTTTEYVLKTMSPLFESNETSRQNVSMDEISEWLQEFHAYINGTKHNASYDTIDFQDLMDDITNRTFSRRKPPLDMKADTYPDDADFENHYDYVNYDITDTNTDQTHENNEFEYKNPVTNTKMTNNIEEKGVTETIIDLLRSVNFNNEFKDYMGAKMPNDRLDDNKLEELNYVNIMKREVTTETSDNTVNRTVTGTISSANTDTNITTTENIKVTIKEGVHIQDLKQKVLHPLNKILKDKEKEINQLIKIREHLILFINFFKDSLGLQVPESLLNYTGKDNMINLPVIRSNAVSLRDKYLLKLKRDVYTVIKDVVTLQKIVKSENSEKLPDEVSFLSKCLQQYLRKKAISKRMKNADQQAIAKDPSATGIPDTRRMGFISEFRRSNDVNPNKEIIIKIMELIDKKLPQRQGLRFLSISAQKIVNRIIEKHYIDEFATTGLRIYDPQYNLTNDLRNIGTQWGKMTSAIENADITDKLYRMKLLHLELETDINRMNDALALINYAHSRRMVPVEENLGEEIMMKINEDLLTINHSILNLLKSATVKKRRKTIKIPVIITEQVTRTPRLSFFKQLKNILRNSKKDLVGVLRQKLPPSTALKQLAKKKLTELKRQKLKDLEDIMLKWQDGLGVITERSKRSAKDYDTIRNRIKSIIPKYLRGKVHPAITAKSSKKGPRVKKTQTSAGRVITNTSRKNPSITLKSTITLTQNAQPTTIKTTLKPTTKVTHKKKATKTHLL